MHSPWDVGLMLIAAHFLCDFALQGDTMAREKNRLAATELQKQLPWQYWMLAHACIHGLAVGLITGRAILGVAEVGVHFSTDCFKCEKWINIHQDQAVHLLSKLVWLAFAFLLAL